MKLSIIDFHDHSLPAEKRKQIQTQDDKNQTTATSAKTQSVRSKSANPKTLTRRSKTTELPQILVTKPPEDLIAQSSTDLSASLPAQIYSNNDQGQPPQVMREFETYRIW